MNLKTAYERSRLTEIQAMEITDTPADTSQHVPKVLINPEATHTLDAEYGNAKPCQSCGGEGRYIAMGNTFKKCQTCKGTGNSIEKTIRNGQVMNAGGKGSGKYPKRTKSKTMKSMHKVLNVRGWTYIPKDGKYTYNDLPGHAVSMDPTGAFTYTTHENSQSGHTIDELKTCLDKMSGKRY